MLQPSRIILHTPQSKPCNDGLTGKVAIMPDAELILRKLSKQSGISIRYIVSEIIVQAEDLIDIKYSSDS